MGVRNPILKNLGWSDDSAYEAEFTSKGFERHSSHSYCIGDNNDNNNPDISLHARGELLMMTVIKEFQESVD